MEHKAISLKFQNNLNRFYAIVPFNEAFQMKLNVLIEIKIFFTENEKFVGK